MNKKVGDLNRLPKKGILCEYMIENNNCIYIYIYVWYLVEKLKGVERNMIMSLFFLLLELPVCKEIPVFGLLLYAYMKLSYGVKEKDDAILSETHYEGLFLHKYVNMKHNPILVSFTSSPIQHFSMSM